MKIYISGKISGLDFNDAFDKFEEAEKYVHKTYFSLSDARIINPMKLHPEFPKKEWIDYMVTDIAELLTCDAIYMLNCWGQSRGARVEYAIAKELGLKIFFENEM